MSDPYSTPSGPVMPEPQPPTRRSFGAGSLLPWLLGAVIVLVLAVIGGLLTAWLVANMRAVPPPVAGPDTPRPLPTAIASVEPSDAQPTDRQTERPRFTPTPSPLVTIEPEPIVHVVERGESLTLIAEFYGVEVEDILELNDIRNPNRIRVGQEILIPGQGVTPSGQPN